MFFYANHLADSNGNLDGNVTLQTRLRNKNFTPLSSETNWEVANVRTINLTLLQTNSEPIPMPPGTFIRVWGK
jgi:hypothetical protein